MTVSLFRRISASFLDLCIILAIVYGLFFIGGRDFLRSNIENYNILNEDYTEIVDNYNADISRISSEYDVAIELAGEDQELKDAATLEYNLKKAIINSQNTIDINPYNDPLTVYFSSVINFFIVAFLILMAILTIATTGKTPGRRILRTKLAVIDSEGKNKKPNVFNVFLHDIVLKYFFIVLVLVYNTFYGVVFMLIAFMLDTILITFTKSNSTIRDFFTRQRVVKEDNYGY